MSDDCRGENVALFAAFVWICTGVVATFVSIGCAVVLAGGIAYQEWADRR